MWIFFECCLSESQFTDSYEPYSKITVHSKHTVVQNQLNHLSLNLNSRSNYCYYPCTVLSWINLTFIHCLLFYVLPSQGTCFFSRRLRRSAENSKALFCILYSILYTVYCALWYTYSRGENSWLNFTLGIITKQNTTFGTNIPKISSKTFSY